MDQIQILVLAGGRGTRLSHYKKKELIKIGDLTIIEHLMRNINQADIYQKAAVVVGHQAELMKKTLGDNYIYPLQKEQLGTGHAVKISKTLLTQNYKLLIVLYGDHPFISAQTIRNIAKEANQCQSPVTMATVKIDDFADWRRFFKNFGRIIRDKKGRIKKIVEAKDCNPQEFKITEVNPGYYCFEKKWLWQNIENISTNNNQNEFYLTDLIEMAFEQGHTINDVSCQNPIEGLGINTPEQLAMAQKIYFKYKKDT